jgi:putative solute:sodium symporter small subunit
MANNHNNNGGIMSNEQRLAYWRANLRLVGTCLAIWFVVSFGFGILLVEQLNSIRIGGFKLGFWFAQQGSIYVFVLLIFFYAWRMNRIDREYDVHED